MDRPLGVTVLAVLAFVQAALGAIPFGGRRLGAWSVFLVFAGIAAGYGLWQLGEWARLLSMLLAAIKIIALAPGLFAALSRSLQDPLVRGLIGILIHGGILLYLSRQRVRQAFSPEGF